MADWEYGGHYLDYDMTGPISLPNDSVVQVADWCDELPEFMLQADTLFIDPPWNKGNVNTFYYKADKPHSTLDFMAFTARLFQRIDDIAPEHLFIEMGKEYLGEYLTECKARFKYVTFYNNTYYHKRENLCYIIHATNEWKRRKHKALEGVDEEDAIAWLCANHAYQCIGDLCMGMGLIGLHAYRNGRRFVGTELNKKRLAVLIANIYTESKS
jgi:hypothetical protein